MAALFSVIIIALVLFLFAYLTRRRFGVLGLALAAGSLLSIHWSGMLTPFLEQQGVVLVTPPLGSVVQITLVLLPAIVLLVAGPRYSKTFSRIVGSVAFALFAITLLSDVLMNILVLQGPSAAFFTVLHDHKSLIIVTAIIIATFDMLLGGKAKPKDDKKSKH